jgi:hypothetical protein
MARALQKKGFNPKLHENTRGATEICAVITYQALLT